MCQMQTKMGGMDPKRKKIQLHTPIKSREHAVLLLERAERLEEKMHAFLHDANNQEDAEVIPLRDTDGDK